METPTPSFQGKDSKSANPESAFGTHPLQAKSTSADAPPRSQAAVPFQLMTEESDSGSSEGEQLLMGALGGQASAPLQAKMSGVPMQLKAAPIQMQAAPIQMQDEDTSPRIPFKITFEGTISREEFKQVAMKQLFGGPVNAKWKLSQETYTSPTTLNVSTALLKEHRGESNSKKGIDSDGTGAVKGAAARRKEFNGSPSGDAKTDVMNEIDRRYYEASGDTPGSKIGAGPKDAGKRELWKQIQDEVLFQNEYVKKLPDGVKQFIKYSTEGKVLTAADLEKLFRIAKTIEAMSPADAHEYLSRVTKGTTDLDAFEASLHRFQEEMAKQRALQEEAQNNSKNLAGLEAIYRKYRTYKTLLMTSSMGGGMGMGPMGGMMAGSGLGSAMAANDLRKEIDDACKAQGFAGGISDFEKFIGTFEGHFEKLAQKTAINYLDKFLGALYREQQAFSDQSVLTTLHAEIKGGASKATLAAKYNIFKDDGLPDDKKVDMSRLSAASTASGLGTILRGYIATRSQDVRDAKAQTTGDPKVIYKMDKMFAVFYAEQSISANSIFDMIIQDKIRRDALFKLAVGILTAICAIALAVVSFGAATPGIIAAGAAAMGLGISAYSVYEEYKNYTIGKDLAAAGLADDPSVVWLIISVAGAVLDMAAAVRVVSSLGPAAKAFQAGGDLSEFQKAIRALQKAGELDARAAAGIEKAALAQKGFSDSKAALQGLTAGKGFKSMADPDVYLELVKMVRFKSQQGLYSLAAFIDEIRAIRTLKGLPDLGPDEIKVIRQAWEEGRAAAKVAGEALEATDEMAKAVKASLDTRIASLGSKFVLEYTPMELKAIITKGRANGFSPQEIEDLILVGSRSDKRLNAIQLMEQMDFSVYIKGRGFPARFQSVADFREFGTTLKSEISAIGGPISDVRIQGSALRKADAGDVDLVAMMTRDQFDDVIRRSYSMKIKEAGKPVDMTHFQAVDFDALAARIQANPGNFGGAKSDYRYVVQNKMINSKQQKKDIKRVFDAENMLENIQKKFPHLNVENVSFQIPGGAFDLQPFLRL